MCDDRCVAWQCRGFRGRGGMEESARPLPSFLSPSFPFLGSDSDLSRIASVGGICIFSFFLFFLPLVYHKKISQSHAHSKGGTFRGGGGGRDGNRQDTLKNVISYRSVSNS